MLKVLVRVDSGVLMTLCFLRAIVHALRFEHARSQAAEVGLCPLYLQACTSRGAAIGSTHAAQSHSSSGVRLTL